MSAVPPTAVARDLRLVPPAAVAFGTTLALGQVDAAQSAAVAVCAACAATGALVVGSWWTAGRGHREQLLMVMVCCIIAGVVSGLGSLQSLSSERTVFAGTEPVRATVTFDVRAIPRTAASGTVVVNARIVEVSKGSDTWRMRRSATVFAEGETWLWLEPGTRVRSVMTTGSGAQKEILLNPISEPEILRRPVGLDALAMTVRNRLHDNAQGLPAPADSLLPSMVLGDQRTVPSRLGEAFLASGLSHLAAVSGANIAYVLGATLFLMSWCGVPRRARLLAGAGAVGLFVCVVGPEPSVLRAGAMAAVSVYALATGRSRQSLALLAAVVLVFSIVSPDTVRALGFVLSVAATAGIVIAASPAERLVAWMVAGACRGLAALWCRIRGINGTEPSRESHGPPSRRHPVTVIAGLVSLAVVAHLSTAPILFATGRPVSPWAIVKNIAVAPAVPWVTVAGTGAAAIAPLAPPVARILAWSCVPSLWWTATVAEVDLGHSGPEAAVGTER